MTDRLEVKAEVAIDDTGAVTGIAWPFGAPDSVGDVIEPGAFAFAPHVPILMEHDQSRVVGVWTTHTETERALEVKGNLFVDGVGPAREARDDLRARRFSGLSIGYRLHEAKSRPEGGRTLTRLTVTEISLCRRPVNPAARILEVKAHKETNVEPQNQTETKSDPVIGKADLDALKASVRAEVKAEADATAARLDKIEAKAQRIATNDNAGDESAERKAFASYLRTGDTTEIKALATDNDPAGGYFVLPTVDTAIRQLLTDLSPMRGLAEVVSIGRSNSYERFYSKGKRGAQWVSERGERPQDTARPELIKHAYGTAELYAAPATTRQMIEDAGHDIVGWLIGNAIHDFAETEGEAFLTGEGLDGAPKGLLSYPTAAEKDFTRQWGAFQHVKAGANTPDDAQLAKALFALVAALRKPYKNAETRFLMNSDTALRLRQIVDANGRFLWAPTGNLIEGVEHPLLGYRVEIDEGMPGIGANVAPIAFGDFRQGYVIVDRQGIRTEEDRLTRKGLVILDTYRRVGGGAGDFNAVKFLKIAA